MSLHPELIGLATIGTEQSQVTWSLPETAAGHLVKQVTAIGHEGQLLLFAAASSWQSQAGFIPGHDRRPRPEPAAQEPGQPCTQKALRQLMVMLQGHYDAVLPEWLHLVQKTGQRVPAEALPHLLTLGRKDKTVRPIIAAALGERGRWLARVASGLKWEWCLPEDTEQAGLEEDEAARLEALEKLRQLDPALARERIQALWPTEKSKERTKLIAILAPGLSLADEPFLEEVLMQERQEVRLTAAALLAQLPGSQLRQRMIARATPLVQWRYSGLHRRPVLAITHLATLDMSTNTDGVKGTPPPEWGDRSKEAWWTEQVLQRVPLHHWCEQFDVTPEQLLVAAANTDTPIRLWSVLAQAVWLARETDMAVLLLRDYLTVLEEGAAASLFSLLTEAEAIPILRHWLKEQKAGFSHTHPAFPLFMAFRHPWPSALTTEFCDSLSRYLNRSNVRPDPALRAALIQFALYISPAQKAELLQTLHVSTSAEKTWDDSVSEIRLLLEFRHEMHQALSLTNDKEPLG